jgi:hypothetical protein
VTPVTLGPGGWLIGVPAVTTPVGDELAGVLLPDAYAVTRKTSVDPTSDCAIWYVVLIAPGIAVQTSVVGLQSSHCRLR